VDREQLAPASPELALAFDASADRDLVLSRPRR